MTPADVVAGVLRHRDGEDPAALSLRIVGALRGHQMLADNSQFQSARPTAAKPKLAVVVQRCANPADPHSGTALVGGGCPICQWRPTA